VTADDLREMLKEGASAVKAAGNEKLRAVVSEAVLNLIELERLEIRDSGIAEVEVMKVINFYRFNNRECPLFKEVTTMISMAIHFVDMDKAMYFAKSMNARGVDMSAQGYKKYCLPAVLTKPSLTLTKKAADHLIGMMRETLKTM